MGLDKHTDIFAQPQTVDFAGSDSPVWRQWERWEIGGVLALALAVRWLTIAHYGLGLNLHSDDQGYMNSALHFLQNGMITYYKGNLPTMHMMPGMTFWLAGLFWLFGTGPWGLLLAKYVTAVVGVLGVFGVYLLARRIFGHVAGLVGALLAAMYPPGILTDTLFLTETPFLASFAFLLYFSHRLAHRHDWPDFFGALICYIIALFFRPTVALYPVVLLFYFLWKRHSTVRLWKQAGVGALIVLAVMTPWWVRNYHDFHHFVPLDDGSGNPLLLGTYQGVGYPDQLTFQQTLKQIAIDYPVVGKDPAAHEEQWMNLQQKVAEQRMGQWWKNNKMSFLYSYLVLKPLTLWQDPFYWIPILRIPQSVVRWMQWKLVILGGLGYLVTLVWQPRSRQDTVWILATFVYYTVLYAAYFCFGRYSEPLMPLVMTGIGAGGVTLWQRLRRLL
ncbi:4-amino-4-deoxy-L-arabinose transferase [Alicyclobacillaceae bacterium I2511]|nr:4-amino-4-deoxy-L-arabinose transferase [Alicyclobacillaceae bacterium I2511]